MIKIERDEVVANCDHLKSLKFSSQLPHAFTEQGIAMLSGVLNSTRAINVNIQIMRTFVKLKQMIMAHKDLQAKREQMEKKYDKQFRVVFQALKQLLEYPKKKVNKIGFR